MVEDLNSSHLTPDVIRGILNPHYIFSLDRTSCNIYSFRVTSMNGSISSSASDSIFSSIPSLPNLSPLENSLRHSLFKSSDGVMFTFSFLVSVMMYVVSVAGALQVRGVAQ